MDQDPNHRGYLHHHGLQHHHQEENGVPHNYYTMQLTTSSYAEPSYMSMHHPQDQNTLTTQHQHPHQHHQHHMGVIPMVSGPLQQMQIPAAITPQPYHQDHGMGMGSPVGTLVYDGSGMGSMVGIGYQEQQNMLGMQYITQSMEPNPLGQDNGFAMEIPLSGQLEQEYTTHPISSANTLTDFTKRKNWPQRLLEEIPDFIHVLSPDGKIIYAAQSAKHVTGYLAEDLMGKVLSDFLHEDDRGLFWRKYNRCVSDAGEQEFRMFYRFKARDGRYHVFDVTGHPHFSNSMEPRMGSSNQRNTGECSGFFMAARPYQQRNAELIDSFLEHRIENERLMQRVADLKREEEMEPHSYGSPARTHSESTPRGDGGYTASTMLTNRSPHGLPPMSPTGGSLTKNNLDSISNVDSIRDKMTRFEGATGADAIEMFTGLRFADGERSKGISTGDTSPALIRGDAGVPIPLETHHRQMGDKKKKMKMTEEYVCTDCGTLESPEWRKGPKGPKTLCNACGLRWAKREKKRNADQMGGMPKQ